MDRNGLKELCVFLTLAFISRETESLHVSVPPGTTQCFYQHVEAYHQGLYATYQVLDDMTDAIQCTVSDANQKSLFNEAGTDGRFSQEFHQHQDVVRGEYSICFGNTLRPVGPALIGFSFHLLESTEDVLSNADATTIGHAQKVSTLVMELNMDLDMVKDNQEYTQARTSLHEDLVENTHHRVLWWSFFELVVLMAVACSQVSFLRRTFEVKRLI